MESKKNIRRVVVKVGTSTLTRANGAINFQKMDALARILSDLKGMGYEIILVSSGAIGIGTVKLRLSERPRELRQKQAAAAVGQCEMMHLYDKFFGEYGQTVAQILLTDEDVDEPHRAENLTGTFEAILSLGVIPIVNENDSVSHAEIETGKSKVLGDNDTLSAIVAVLCHADLLILLSDIDGLYTSDPHKDPNARRIELVTTIDEKLKNMAGGVGSQWGTGGMSTKISAAEIAMSSGVDMVIANGEYPERLYDLFDGKQIGTLFSGKEF